MSVPVASPANVPLGIRAQIVAGPYGTCANGGLSERVREVTIVAERSLVGAGTPKDRSLTELVLASIPELTDLQAPSDEAPAAVLVVRRLGGRLHFHVEPAEPCPPRRLGYMAGGSTVEGPVVFALTGQGEVKLHDRTETAAQYHALSI